MIEKRFILFLIITFIVMGTYPFVIEKLGLVPPPPKQTSPEKNLAPINEESKSTPGDPEINDPVEKDPSGFDASPGASFKSFVAEAGREEEINIETPLYHARFSSRGAELLLWELREYTREDRKTPIVLFTNGGGVSPGFGVSTGDPGIDAAFAGGNYAVSGPQDIKLKAGEKEEVVFRFKDPRSGVYLSKRFIFNGDTYLVGVEIETEGLRKIRFNLGSDFGITDWGDPAKGFIGFIGPVTFLNEETVKDKPSKIDGEVRHRGLVGWTSLQDKYFISAAIPKTTAAAVVYRPTEETVSAALEFEFPGTGIKTTRLDVYAGPKEHDRLKKHYVGLEKSIDFGWFIAGSWGIVRFLAEPLFYVLRFFHGYTGNFGISIILLTVCVRILFIPLTHKAFRSMKNMQVLQPELKALQTKYKDDKPKLQKEMLALYQNNKVNPLGGCLPMLLQIPVFVALYNVLYTTIELRQAPFYLWIQDLSLKDPIYVLPLIMGASMFLQQKLQPTTLEPTQAKIMLLMPVFITFLFFSFPSGLVLYMVTNNVLTIAQQYFTMNLLDGTRKPQKESQGPEGPDPTDKEEPRGPGGGKKSRPPKRPRRT